jgi:WD40 repeat protein
MTPALASPVHRRFIGLSLLFLAIAIASPAEETGPDHLSDGCEPSAASPESATAPLPPHAVQRIGPTRFAHGGLITGLAFMPDGQRIVSGSKDGTVSLWDAQTGVELRRIDHRSELDRLALSPDGKLIAAQGAGRSPATWNKVFVWAAESGEFVHCLSTTNSVSSLAFSPDGKLLVAGNSDGIAHGWRMPDGDEAFRLAARAVGRAANDGLRSISFSPDSVLLATRGLYEVRTWDLRTGDKRTSFPAPKQGGEMVMLDAGDTLVIGDGMLLRVVSAHTGKDLQEPIPLRLRQAHWLQLSADRRFLAYSELSSIQVRDLKTGEVVLTQPHLSLGVSAFAPQGGLLATTFDNRIRLWDLVARRPLSIPEVDEEQGTLGPIAVSPDGRVVLSAGSELQAWDLDLGNRMWRHQSSAPITQSDGGSPFLGEERVAFLPGGKSFAATLRNGEPSVAVWSLGGDQPEARLYGHHQTATCVTASVETHRLASGSWDGTIRIWDSDRRTAVSTIKASERRHGVGVLALTFSPDGKRIASGTFGEPVKIWEVETGEKLLELGEIQRHPLDLAYSPDGRHLACASRMVNPFASEFPVQVWDCTSGRPVCRLNSAQPVHCVEFLSGIAGVATGGEGHLVRLWDLPTQRPVAELEGHRGCVFALAVTPDVSRLISVSSDSIFVWDVEGAWKR